MARTATPKVELVSDVALDGETLVAQQNQVISLNAEHDSQVRAVAAQLGYQLPADCTDPDLIQRDIAANMRRSVEAARSGPSAASAQGCHPSRRVHPPPGFPRSGSKGGCQIYERVSQVRQPGQ